MKANNDQRIRKLTSRTTGYHGANTAVDNATPTATDLWDQLLPQAEITLNLLGAQLNPKLSAWAQLHGTFDFNRTPLAPPGIHVIVHEKPGNRTSWSPHGLDGWYTGPAIESYHCYTCWI